MSRESVIYYELRRVEVPPLRPGESRLVTAAVLSCSLCGGIIDGMGGPGDAPVCVRCADVLSRGKARGAIVWDDEDTSQNPGDPQ